MQPCGMRTEQAETPEQDHARDRVRGLRQAGTREVVVDKALRQEPAEEPLHNPLL